MAHGVGTCAMAGVALAWFTPAMAASYLGRLVIRIYSPIFPLLLCVIFIPPRTWLALLVFNLWSNSGLREEKLAATTWAPEWCCFKICGNDFKWQSPKECIQGWVTFIYVHFFSEYSYCSYPKHYAFLQHQNFHAVIVAVNTLSAENTSWLTWSLNSQGFHRTIKPMERTTCCLCQSPSALIRVSVSLACCQVVSESTQSISSHQIS